MLGTLGGSMSVLCMTFMFELLVLVSTFYYDSLVFSSSWAYEVVFG